LIPTCTFPVKLPDLSGSNLTVTCPLCPGESVGSTLTILYGAAVLKLSVTEVVPSFFTVRVFSIGKPTCSV
jgi:hypothetical protein